MSFTTNVSVVLTPPLGEKPDLIRKNIYSLKDTYAHYFSNDISVSYVVSKGAFYLSLCAGSLGLSVLWKQ